MQAAQTSAVARQLGWLEARRDEVLSLSDLLGAGIDRLPLPGAGAGGTLARWRILAAVAAHDLSLVKLFEGHTDALAIQAELGVPPPPPDSRWGTWCAEPPDARLEIRHGDVPSQMRLTGTKAWCSGAASLTHAIVSGWNEQGKPCLVAVALSQPGVELTAEGWHAVGMAGSGSVDVRFDQALAAPVGTAGDYVRRPGFWHGGAGIAACWWGGASAIARTVRDLAGLKSDAHRLAHVGAIDVALAASGALLRECAAWIDAHPIDDAQAIALRARLAVEQTAGEVVGHAGRALGAGPLCRNARFAQAMADLPVFVRQSHAERDSAALGTGLLREPASLAWPWAL
ncbi:MAG: acyl-CoA dehydrogenase [Variovorax sp.]